MSWARFIHAAPASGHAVQVYDEVDDLVESVVRFLAPGAPAIAIVTPDHRARIEAALGDNDVVWRDAEETLAAFMEGGMPSPSRFVDVVGGLVDEVAARFPGETIRAFGEMVDVLWQQGNEEGALWLEELWNELAETRRFSLLCGYRFDIFDPAVQQHALPRVFAPHTHVRPAADALALSAAVDRALADVAGPLEAARIYLDVAQDVPRGKTSRSQAVLGWLSTQRSDIAAKVCTQARSYYLTPRD
ncbi:MAG: MEDS domain-containing protein [Actinobacteria bacterium]|nr:MEDS domain-containing protein [Actinomycetota bacterium]